MSQSPVTNLPHGPRVVATVLRAAAGGPVLECRRCGHLAVEPCPHNGMGSIRCTSDDDFAPVTFPPALLAQAQRLLDREAAKP